MIDLSSQLLPSLFFGVALSSAAGFRVFLPLLAANLATKFGFMPFALGAEFVFLGSNSATAFLIVASLVELAAYYVPFIDNMLDTVAAPAAAIAGTILTTSVLQIEDPTIKWALGILAGGGIASTLSASSGMLRLASTKLTAGVGNPVLSTFENVFSLTTILLSFLIPTFLAVISILFAVWILKKLFRKSKSSV